MVQGPWSLISSLRWHSTVGVNGFNIQMIDRSIDKLLLSKDIQLQSYKTELHANSFHSLTIFLV